MLSRPAAKINYSVAGRTVLIEAHDGWSSRAVSELFAGWFLTKLPEQVTPVPDLTLRVRCGLTSPAIPPGLSSFVIAHGGTCHTDNDSYYLRFDDSLISFGSEKDARVAVDLWVDRPYELSSPNVAQLFSHALSPALRRCGIFEIHSAGVIASGGTKAIMIAGPSGSGKSTLTSQLALCGWGYLSDDILLLQICDEEIRVGAFRRFFALTHDTIAAVKLSRSELGEAVGTSKERVTPQDHFATNPIEQAVPGTVVFPTLTGERRSQLVRLTAAESMTRLLRLSPWASYDKPTSREHLQLLGRLANTTQAFDLLAGTDILHDPKLAADLIYNATVETTLAQ